MDELFGNLIYLLPIALIIVRVISAAGNSKKKTPPSNPSARSAETPRRVPEQGMDPGMREFLRSFGLQPPEAAPPAEPKPVRKRTAKKPVPPKEPAKALLAEAPLTEALDTPEQARPGQAFQAEARSVPELLEGLSPLQQGFVWAEILGPAKAMRDLGF